MAVTELLTATSAPSWPVFEHNILAVNITVRNTVYFTLWVYLDGHFGDEGGSDLGLLTNGAEPAILTNSSWFLKQKWAWP